MTVILAEEHREAWLNNQAGKDVLVLFPATAMRAWPISPSVNSPKNNDPDLLARNRALRPIRTIGLPEDLSWSNIQQRKH